MKRSTRFTLLSLVFELRGLCKALIVKEHFDACIPPKAVLVMPVSLNASRLSFARWHTHVAGGKVISGAGFWSGGDQHISMGIVDGEWLGAVLVLRKKD